MTSLPAKPAFSSMSPYWLAARDIYQTMRRLGAQNPLAIAALANADMESAFHTNIVGDKGTAFNLWQWHTYRADRIAENTGIYVKSEHSIPKVVSALWWEMTHVRAYAHAFDLMDIASTANEAAGLFCQYIEGAGAPNAKERRELDASWWSVAIAKHPEFFALQPDP